MKDLSKPAEVSENHCIDVSLSVCKDYAAFVSKFLKVVVVIKVFTNASCKAESE